MPVMVRGVRSVLVPFLVVATVVAAAGPVSLDAPPWDLSYQPLLRKAKPEHVAHFRANIDQSFPARERLLTLVRHRGVQSMILLEETPGSYSTVKLFVRTAASAHYYGLSTGTSGRDRGGSRHGSDAIEITPESYDRLYALLAARAVRPEQTPRDTGTVRDHPASGRQFVAVVNLYRAGKAEQRMLSAADYFTRAVPPPLDDINAALFAGMHYRMYDTRWEWAWRLERKVTPAKGQALRDRFDEAIGNGDWPAAAALLEQGVDVNGFNRRGTTAYIAAVALKREDIAERLVHRGADPLRPNLWGETADDVRN